MNDSIKQQAVIGRFAPSPTGPLHVGSLVTAVGSWVMAKRQEGEWLLRIEDLDAPRVIPGMADDILRTLESLGLEWDGDILRQSDRTEYYREALDLLLESDLAYPCGCTRAEIARISSAPHEPDGDVTYPGTCRSGLPAGKSPRSIRVRVSEAPVSFSDCIMGEMSESLSDTCGDFVVRRADGPFAYHLAVVVDDAAQGVTQVVRGADLLSSTPRQIYLQQLLQFPVPHYCHLPLVTDPDGNKLSKRDNAVSLSAGGLSATDAGKLIVSSLRFLGQNIPADLEGASAKEILAWAVGHFNVSCVPKGPAPFEPHP